MIPVVGLDSKDFLPVPGSIGTDYKHFLHTT